MQTNKSIQRSFAIYAFYTVIIFLRTECVVADALVVTKAMQASTIAEIFIDQQCVRVELEIATSDMKIFQDLLPEKLYAEMSKDELPLTDRHKRFLRQRFVLLDQQNRQLVGKIEQTTIRRRISRDEVTGQPLPEQPVDAELILHAQIKYDFEDKPTRLIIRPPLLTGSQFSAANIGFVCYHNGLPVNDFRYMSGEVTLDLDWSDSWYSQFQHPNLRRKFDAPLSVYLYVEPYEVRKEIIVRPKDLLVWLDLGVGENTVIPVNKQAELKKRVAEFLLAKNPVMIDGKPAKAQLDRIHFIHRTLRTTGIVEPPVDLDMTSATLGIIFVYPTDKLPEEVSMTWELFSPKIQDIPAVASDEAGGLPSRVTPDDPVLYWKNYLTNPTSPNFATIALPKLPQKFSIPVISAMSAGFVILLSGLMIRLWKMKTKIRSGLIGSIIACMIIGLITLPIARIVVADPFAETPEILDEELNELMTGLLYNVYRAFDHHNESLIYDRLSQSIAGDLLSKVYLETRESMEVKNQGGLRISVKEVTVTNLESVSQNSQSELTFRCSWRVAGWIGHWGHIHQRVNEHLALVTVAAIDGKWKIKAIEMLDEKPIESPQEKTESQEVGSK